MEAPLKIAARFKQVRWVSDERRLVTGCHQSLGKRHVFEERTLVRR
jgi:hypothetical protein